MIRLMEINDYEEVFKQWVIDDPLGLRKEEDSYEAIDIFLKNNPTTSFVFENEGKIIGSILAGNDARRGYIYRISVVDKYNRNMICSALVDQTIKAMNALGIKKIGCHMYTDSIEERDFWLSQDFILREDLVYFDKLIGNEDDY
ncbi:MAG: GNAT family N-acetyltransferase [Thomasclavelia sp.]|jgi:predicted N-acetyltransferase YhbS|nr:GNAT family N-acetyltransferase [Thomasclavelia sp.]